MLGFSLGRLSMAPMAIVGLMLAAPELAHADQFVTFYGGHPIPASHGGGWCNDNAKHFHSFAPEDYYLYSEYDGNLYFIGDPNDFGYSGKSYQYWDHHRIDVRVDNTVVTVGYCYIPGPHTHNYAPGNESYYHQFYYNNAYYYYWYEDLWSYPGYSRYYDTYYDYWYVSFPTYYPHCSQHTDVDISWGNDVVQRPHNGYSNYSGKGSNPKSNKGYSTGNNGRSYGDSSIPGYSTSGGNKGNKGNSNGYSSSGTGSNGSNGYSSGAKGSNTQTPTYTTKPKGAFGRGDNSTGSNSSGSYSGSKGSSGSTGSGKGVGIFSGKGSGSSNSSSGSSSSSSKGSGSSSKGSSSSGKGSGSSSGSSSSSGKGSSSGSNKSSSGGYSTGKGKGK